MLTDSNVADALAPAGLLFVERALGEVRLPPLYGRSPASCRPEHGRFDSRPEECVDADDPQFAVKVNACWLRMATEFGLLDQEREFLLGVDYSQDFGERKPAWVRVRLLETWDLVESEVTLLGDAYPHPGGQFVPEFAAVSLDGRVLLNVTLWGNGTVSTIAIRPQ